MKKQEEIGILLMDTEWDGPDTNAIRFKEELEGLGFRTEYLFINRFFVVFTKSGIEVKYDGKTFPIDRFKMLIFIANKPITFDRDTLFIRALEHKGVVIKNCFNAVERAKNKMHSLFMLSESKLPIVDSAVNFSEVNLQPFFDLIPEEEYIMKYNQGSLGKGVSYIKSKMSLISIFEMLRSIGSSPSKFIVQKYIKESHGIDIRVIATKKRVLAGMKRTSNGFDFRSNIQSGGSGTPFKVTKEMEEITLEAIDKLGLDYGGVDFGESKEGPVIYEVNANPGLIAESVTGVNIVKEILKDIID